MRISGRGVLGVAGLKGGVDPSLRIGTVVGELDEINDLLIRPGPTEGGRSGRGEILIIGVSL